MAERVLTSREAGSFDFKCIHYGKAGYVATVAFNRPQVLNAINYTTLAELAEAFKDAAWDDGIAVVVLTGAGDRAFCTGADLREQQSFVERPRDYCKWMSVHNASPETHEGVASFFEKRPPDHGALRRRAAEDQSPEYAWGPPLKMCPHCGARNLPAAFEFCGRCGKPLG